MSTNTQIIQKLESLESKLIGQHSCIYEREIAQLGTKLDIISQKLDKVESKQEEIIGHDKRISVLEQGLKMKIALISAIGSIIGAGAGALAAGIMFWLKT